MIFIVITGMIYALVLSIYLMAIMKLNPRLLLQDYPEKVKKIVKPKSKSEKKQSIIVGIPFLLLMFLGPLVINVVNYNLHGTLNFWQIYGLTFLILMIFNIVDLIVLDLLIFSWITPNFIRIKGADEKELYEGNKMHFKGFGIGSIFALVSSFAIAGIVTLIV